MSRFFDVYCFIMMLLILKLSGIPILFDYKLWNLQIIQLTVWNAAPLEGTIAWLRLMYKFHISPENCFYWYKSSS